MPPRLRLSLKAPDAGQDNFFLWSIIILPIIAEGAYIFDAWYFFSNYATEHDYQGLTSTILVVFTYLRYCVPIDSSKILVIYFLILCILNELGTIGYLVIYIQHGDILSTIVYFGWALLELLMTSGLIYYRVYRRCHPTFLVESKHLFHFLSRLEVILAIFIPFFINNISVTLTKHSIAFFLLFDFFAESYHRFQGFWIKTVLYVFVCTVTISVASEWAFSAEHEHKYETISTISELVSACLCNTLIIFQFIPFHFRPLGIAQIARDGWISQQTKTKQEDSIIEISSEPLPLSSSSEVKTTDSVFIVSF